MNLKFRSLFQKDIDQVFSYRTNVEVVILDRYVGIIYRILQLLIIAFFFYIVNYNYIISKKTKLNLEHNWKITGF